jgi:hypothetical protein
MSQPRIESYRFGHVVIDGQVHTKDVIILPDHVIGGWWRREGHTLLPDDLEAVLAAAPEVLVVGKGAFGRMQVAWKTKEALQAAGIDLIAESTGEAAETYNRLRGEKAVAAALHLSC